jgi:hypothetical protein
MPIDKPKRIKLNFKSFTIKYPNTTRVVLGYFIFLQ